MTDPVADLRPMMQRDRASSALGMRVEVDEPGRAVVSMIVREDMLNGFDITHGGLVFALADTTFGSCATRMRRSRWPRAPTSPS